MEKHKVYIINRKEVQELCNSLTSEPQVSSEQVRKEMRKVFGDDVVGNDIKERVKTFADACRELGGDHPLVKAYSRFIEAVPNLTESCRSLVAYAQLAIITEALNEGWSPQFVQDETRYYPFFFLYTKEEYDLMSEEEKSRCRFIGSTSSIGHNPDGCVYANAYYGFTCKSTTASSRLMFKSRDLANYCANQFFIIWASYMFE